MVPNPLILPVPFPEAQFDDPVYFKKDNNFTGRMPRAVLQRLYTAGCVEVTGLPACDLTNTIHPLFRAAAFTQFSAAEYNFIRPAVLLASRFITEDNYMKFWKRMYSGHADTNPPGGEGPHTIRIPPTHILTPNQLLTNTRQALVRLSTRLTIHCWDAETSRACPITAGESYTDPDDWKCKRHRALNGDKNTCGDCKYCNAMRKFRCAICGETSYAAKKCTKAILRGLLDRRGIAHQQLVTKDDLVTEIEADDVRRNGVRPATYRTTLAQLSELRIGLRHEVIEHIQEALAGRRWTASEEIRFQFALAVTLCHETVHQFWWFRSRRCWQCEGDCPWWAPNDKLKSFEAKPELGNSWEMWAFGSRLANAGKLRENARQVLPNIFQRCQWYFVPQTVRGGPGNRPGVFRYDYVLPVEYINEWFQESTWTSIANNGRRAGRPNFDDVTFLRQTSARMTLPDKYNVWDCSIANYTYPQLVANGGFDRANDHFLHGTLATGNARNMLRDRLLGERDARKKARKTMKARRERRRMFG